MALPDGRLASGSQDGTVRAWGGAALTERGGRDVNDCDTVLGAFESHVNALAVLPGGRLACGTEDGEVPCGALAQPWRVVAAGAAGLPPAL